MTQVTVFGLGKLGAVLAAVLADSGHIVKGYDTSQAAVDAINAGAPLNFEPYLGEILNRNSNRLSAFNDASTALSDSDVAYIIVPTPSLTSGAFSNDFILEALLPISQQIAENSRFLTVVIASTVMPGSCSNEFIPFIERFSGKSVGIDFGLVYSPEFIALGSIVKDMHFPDLVLIGESDARAGDIASRMALSVVKNEPEVRRMSLPSAEITKIAINTFVTTKISYANMLGELCDQIPGANIDDVTEAVGADSRVGHLYLKAALGYGGPCFPRDNAALSVAAESRGVRAEIARATDAINSRQVSRIVSLVAERSSPGDTVVIAGLAYKANTPVVDSSQAVEIGKALTKTGRTVIGFDPLVFESASEEVPFGFPVTNDLSGVLVADVVVVANPSLDIRPVIYGKRDVAIIDLWGSELDRHENVTRPGRPSLSEGLH